MWVCKALHAHLQNKVLIIGLFLTAYYTFTLHANSIKKHPTKIYGFALVPFRVAKYKILLTKMGQAKCFTLMAR